MNPWRKRNRNRRKPPGPRFEMPKLAWPRAFSSGSTEATTTWTSAIPPLVMNTFVPFSTHSSPSRSARVRSEARSEPAFGSEKPRHQSSSALRSVGRNRAFCSAVPNARSVGAEILIE
jgi:hypothetical protein